jgi:hypothetical protein
MPFTRYEQNNDGSYTFIDPDTGGSMRAAGPAAEQHAASLDAESLYATPAMPAPEAAPEPDYLAAAGPVAPGAAMGEAGRQAAKDKAALAAAAAKGPPKRRPVTALGDFDMSDAAARDAADLDAAVAAKEAADRAAAPAPAATTPPEGAPPAASGPPGLPPGAIRAPAGAAGDVVGVPRTAPDAAPAPPPMAVATSDSTTVQSGTTSGSSSGFQRSMGPAPETVTALEGAQRKKAQVDAQIVNLQANASQEIADEHDDVARRYMAWQTEQRLIEDETQKKLEPINAAMMKAVDDVRNAKVDPGKFWKDAGVGGQIGAAVAMAFGAIAQGMKGGQNDAFNVIQAAVDRDVQLQLADIDKKRADVGMLAQVGREIRAQGGDIKAQELGMFITGLEASKAKIDGVAARADAAVGTVIDPVTGKQVPSPVSLKAQQMIAEADVRIAAMKVELSERIRGTVQGQSQTQRSSQVSKTHSTQETPTDPAGAGKLRTIVLDDGTGTAQRWAVNDELRDEDYSKMIANAELIKQLNASVAEMESLKKKYSGLSGLAMRAAGEQFKWHSVQAGRIISTLVKQGVLMGAEQKQVAIENGNIVDGDEVIGAARDFGKRARGFIIDQGNAAQVPMDYGRANPNAPRAAPKKKGKH